MATALMVWIDQDLCTGDGICEEICGDVFTARDDGLWVVKEEAKHFGSTVVFDGKDGDGHGPDGGQGGARIPDSLLDSAVEAAEECPGECIMIEPYDQAAIDSRGVVRRSDRDVRRPSRDVGCCAAQRDGLRGQRTTHSCRSGTLQLATVRRSVLTFGAQPPIRRRRSKRSRRRSVRKACWRPVRWCR